MSGGTESRTHRRRSSAMSGTVDTHAPGAQGREDPDRIGEEDSDAGSDDWDEDEETGLTHTERKRRRQRKGRIDGRIVATAEGDAEEDVAELKHKEEDKTARTLLLRNILVNGGLIALWYSFSISISVYNKWMFSKSKDRGLDFHYPLFTTSLHMIVQFLLATAVLYFFPRFRPRTAEKKAATQLDGLQESSTPKPLMTRWFYFSRVGPCGAATAFDIGLGNFSLRFISLTFYTMCKSSVLGFVLVFAIIFRLEHPTWALCAIIVVMTSGVIMMVAGETAFDALGFVLVMTASACSGFRWSLTQILLLRNAATSNPFSSIFFLTPVMFLALFLLALPVEGIGNVIVGLQGLAAAKGWFLGTCIMLFPGCLAFMMVAAEFALLQRSSVVTLSVCGIFKEVLTISTAGVIFGDELSPINVSGLVVTIVAIAGYNYLKWRKMADEARQKAREVEGMPLRDSDERFDEAQEGLMRDSSIDMVGTTHDGNLKTQVDGRTSSSPVKRPENLE